MIIVFIIFCVFLQIPVWKYAISEIKKGNKSFKNYAFYLLCVLIVFVSSYHIFGFIPELEDPFFEIHKTLNKKDFFPTTILTFGCGYVLFVTFLQLLVSIPYKIWSLIGSLIFFLSWPFRKLIGIFRYLNDIGALEWLKPIVRKIRGFSVGMIEFLVYIFVVWYFILIIICLVTTVFVWLVMEG